MKSPRLLFGAIAALVFISALGVAWFTQSDEGEWFGPPDDDGDLSPEAVLILDAPDSFTLYSLHPIPMDFRQSFPSAPQASTNVVRHVEAFHGFEILGQTEISDPTRRKELVDSFKLGIEQGKGPPPACFNPRHGIRASKNGVMVDFVICFECVSVNEVMGSTRHLRVSASPRDTFNKALKTANLPLAPE